MNPSVLFEVQKYYPRAFELFTEHKEKCIYAMLAENLKKGIEKGLYRKELNVEIITVLRMEQVQMALNPEVFPPGKYTLQEIQLQFIEHFLFGICTLKGHKLINKYKQINEED